MGHYIYSLKGWPSFTWESDQIITRLAHVRNMQGRLLGRLEALGFQLQEEATLEILTQDVLKSSEIEGEKLPEDQVRSSIAQRLGIEFAGEVLVSRNVEGVVELMLDATQRYDLPLTDARLFDWQSALFPTGRSGLYHIQTGDWRDDATGPMQVVSGALGRERVHFEGPAADRVPTEMNLFLEWFNASQALDPVVKAAIAHLWFVTIHPFDDGNGRIARAIADMQLARADGSRQRFYSMSAQIQRERRMYYEMLERTQRGNLNITEWLIWFIECLGRSISLSEENLSRVIQKAKFWEQNQANSLNSRQRAILNKLMEGFHGKLTTSKWAKMARCSSDTALRDIQDLITKGILEREESGGRSTSYRLKLT